MRIALAAQPVIDRDVPHNLQVILDTVCNLQGQADLIVFGEAVLQGFDAFSWQYEQDQAMAVTIDGPIIYRLRAAAAQAEVALSFGYLEKSGDRLYSSQLFIGRNGTIVQNYHRVSPGWKEPCADWHYVQGQSFLPFSYLGKCLVMGLCGDLWTPGRPEELQALAPDILLWPVWCDYDPEDWNAGIKLEYARQAALCGRNVLLVNPVCKTPSPEGTPLAAGGAAWFRDGVIVKELPAGEAGVLLLEL